MTSAERRRGARRATLVGIAGNSLLFAGKGAVGVASGSIALLSDAFNSLVDVVASIAIWYSVRVAHRDPDLDHPFGHQRAEIVHLRLLVRLRYGLADQQADARVHVPVRGQLLRPRDAVKRLLLGLRQGQDREGGSRRTGQTGAHDAPHSGHGSNSPSGTV